MTELASQAADRANHMDEYDQYDRIIKLREMMDKRARLDFCARTMAKDCVAIDLVQRGVVK